MDAMAKMLVNMLGIDPKEITDKVNEAITAIEYFQKAVMNIDERLARLEKHFGIQETGAEIVTLELEDMTNE